MKTLAVILMLILLALIAKQRFFSFRAQSPDDYAETGPQFVLKEHLSGPILSDGLIYGPGGRVTNSFTAEMYGEWDGDTGTLSETFTYSNGKTQERKWYLKLESENRFTAMADDIVGVGEGVISGSTASLTYNLILPEDAGGHVLQVTDWMYLTGNGTIMNKSEMRKFGIKLVELVANMRPDPAEQEWFEAEPLRKPAE